MINFISRDKICNLGRLPISMDENPMYKTCLEIINNPEIDSEKSSLFGFYQSLKFETLGDLYSIKERDCPLNKYQSDHPFLPWIHTFPITRSCDPHFIEQASTNIIKEEVNKLKKLILSIDKDGYTPEKHLDRKHGHITGYFLEMNDAQKFYVVSGNHRVAVLSALLPKKDIPFLFEKTSFMKPHDRVNNGVLKLGELPSVYSASNVERWPSVNSGFISPSIAIKILGRYMSL